MRMDVATNHLAVLEAVAAEAAAEVATMGTTTNPTAATATGTGMPLDAHYNSTSAAMPATLGEQANATGFLARDSRFPFDCEHKADLPRFNMRDRREFWRKKVAYFSLREMPGTPSYLRVGGRTTNRRDHKPVAHDRAQ